MAEPTERCYLDPTCERGPHARQDFPCGGPPHVPGEPCEFCGKATPLNGDPCWDCWTPITVADFKAIVAEAGRDTIFTPKPTEETPQP